jgi:hypothetical protein
LLRGLRYSPGGLSGHTRLAPRSDSTLDLIEHMI